jgi:hypothetical protein
MIMMQLALLATAAWFGWKKRDALERAARAARAAWDEGREPAGGPFGDELEGALPLDTSLTVVLPPEPIVTR